MASPTILIVEDDDIARIGLTTLLRAHGYQTASAADGKVAWEGIHAGLIPDLILLDMIIPVFDGWRFLAQRQHDPMLRAVPVAIMTALGVASPEWARSLGADALLLKPLDVDVLLETMRRLASPPDAAAAASA